MAPPTATEQLIRDYLNRLSVAARDLAADDRRELLERTRSVIEQKVNLARRPSTMDVGRVLARLGDPAALVEQERRRLAAQGKAVPRSTPAAPRQGFLARAAGREHARPRGPGFPWSAMRVSGGSASPVPSNGVSNGIQHWVAPAESGSSDAASSAGVSAAPPAADAEPFPSAGAPASGRVTAGGPLTADGAQAPDAQAAADRPAADPAVPGSSPVSGVGAVGVDDHPADAGTPAPDTKGARDGTAPAAAGAAGRTGRGAAADDDTRAARARRTADGRRLRVLVTVPDGAVRRQASRLFAWARKRPLEAAAIALMGIGGPIFPPVFLIGATLALASELWDGRDKWIGLTLPIVLTLIALILGIAAGGRAHWQHEGWVYLDVVSRVAPVLGAAYLAWRTQRPRRPPPVPPFIRPPRTS